MTNAQKKECAYEYYMENKSQKRISELLKVSEQTISKWATEEGWHEERSKANTLIKNISTRLLTRIDYNLRVLENTEDPNAKIPDDKGVVDSLSKLFSAFRQKEMPLKQQLTCLTNFLEFTQEKEFEATQKVTPLVQTFLEKQHKND